MKYRIVSNKTYREPLEISIGKLEDKVRELIKEGWKVQGGIALSSDTYGQHIMQVMVKDDDLAISAEPPAKKTPVRKKAKTADEIVRGVKERNKK